MVLLTHQSVANNSTIQNPVFMQWCFQRVMPLNLVICGYFFFHLPNHLLNPNTLLHWTTLSWEFLYLIYSLCGRSPPVIFSAPAACLLYLRVINAVSWTVKHNWSPFILCVANGCRGLNCILSSALSFSCWHLLLTELVQTFIIPAVLLSTHSSFWVTSQNTQGAGTWGSHGGKKKFPVVSSIPFFVISSIWFVFLTLICFSDLVDIVTKFSIPVAVREAIILHRRFSYVNHLFFNIFHTLGFVPNTHGLCSK